jgi:hypothetical protein
VLFEILHACLTSISNLHPHTPSSTSTCLSKDILLVGQPDTSSQRTLSAMAPPSQDSSRDKSRIFDYQVSRTPAAWLMGRTLRGQRQGTLRTLSQMLDPAASSSTNSNTSKLITLPNEVIFKIIGDKALTVFDRSCLMLTSKAAAWIVNSSSAAISIPTIQRGEEEFTVEMQKSANPGCEECATLFPSKTLRLRSKNAPARNVCAI